MDITSTLASIKNKMTLLNIDDYDIVKCAQDIVCDKNNVLKNLHIIDMILSLEGTDSLFNSTYLYTIGYFASVIYLPVS
jgi:hypothetical protein